MLHGISNYSWIRSAFCSCSTYCSGLGFQHQNLQDFTKISRVLNTDIYLRAVDGYYVVAGIGRHEYKQGWKVLTMWDGKGLSEATWEPMSAFIQPDGSINPFFRSYLVENNERQLLTPAETLSQRTKKNSSPCAYLFIVPNRTEEVASFRRRWYTPDIPSSRWESPLGHSCRGIGSPRRYISPSPEEKQP